jgi:hypothetical protein
VADWSALDIAKTVLAPALGIIGGWVSASLKIATRMTLLEKDVEKLEKKQKEDHEKLEKDHGARITSISSGFQLALASQKNDLDEKIVLVRTDLDELERSYNSYTRSSHHDFTNNEEFRRFTEEWQRQCQKIQRTLGQIEGMIQRETRHSSRLNQQDSDQPPGSEGSPRARR